MERIDAHQHFWKYIESDYIWMNDQMKVLKRDYLPDELKAEQRKIGFDGSIAVQARQMEEENEFLLELANTESRIKGIVGWVDLRSGSVAERLEYYSSHPKFVGVRHVLHDEPDPDFMLEPKFLNGISLLKDLNLTYDILILPLHLPDTIKFVEKFPEQKFVVDHIAKPLIKNKLISPWKEQMKTLHQFLCYVALATMMAITLSTAWGETKTVKKEIHVFLERQILVAMENGEEVYNFDIVTGKDGKETTAGSYRIFSKHKKYTSKKYGSEMPYTMFFTKDGKAIHGTQMATLRSYLHTYLTESVARSVDEDLGDDTPLFCCGCSGSGKEPPKSTEGHAVRNHNQLTSQFHVGSCAADAWELSYCARGNGACATPFAASANSC